MLGKKILLDMVCFNLACATIRCQPNSLELNCLNLVELKCWPAQPDDPSTIRVASVIAFSVLCLFSVCLFSVTFFNPTAV